MDGDWVTMGVIVSKTDPRVSSKASVTVIVYRTVVAYYHRQRSSAALL